MPLFTFECSCGNVFEKLIKERKSNCPKCNKETNKIYIGHSSFILKGGGWAKEGYSSVQKSGGITTRTPMYSNGSMGAPEIL